MIPEQTTAAPPPIPARRRLTAAAAAAGALAVFAAGCAAPAAGDGGGDSGNEGVPAPAAAPPAAELTEQDVNAWLDGVVPGTLDSSGIPGAVVSVVADGEILTVRGYGYADTGADGGAPVPVDPERTLFRVGSVSKLVTATAVMGLVEEGVLDLDADVHEYLDFTVPTAFDEPLTLRHLLTHTPGFEERIRGMFLTGQETTDLRTYLAEDPPEQVYPPGTVPAYSNYGVALAGYIVERTAGVPFEEYVEEAVFEPLGMDSSTFAQPLPEGLGDRTASGYTDDTGPAGEFESVLDSPAGALTASAPDMARFMLAHLGDLDGLGLSDETLELMHSPALGEDSLGTLAAGRRMTLGFFEEDRNGRRALGHGGDTMYFHSHLQIHPDDGTGVFVSFNGGGYPDGQGYFLREEITAGFMDRYLPREDGAAAGTGAGQAATDTAAEHAAMAAGTYIGTRAVRSNFLAVLDLVGGLDIRDRGDGTILVTPGTSTGHPQVYEEVEPWLWREVGGHRLISMRAEDGRVEAIGFDPANAFLRAGPAVTAGPPVLLLSLAVLLVAVLSWPVGAVVRRILKRPARDRAGRTARVLTRVGVSSAVAAAAGWVLVLMSLMGMNEIPAAALLGLHVLQLVGVLAIPPAAWALVGDVRRRAGWKRYAAGVLVLAALVGMAWFALSFGLLSFDPTY
ncbi:MULTISPECIES: serine hydrolase domain-containing protein [unclassified Nocardiopsis]|uniref:serine hydrolase domain-containing protein n=1 Tax=Nocardiopsis TaxID=2013 RepID=UPI00387B0F0D